MSLCSTQSFGRAKREKGQVDRPSPASVQRQPQSMHSVLLDELDENLTNNSKVAASLGDEFLVYLLDMAILQVRKSAARLE